MTGRTPATVAEAIRVHRAAYTQKTPPHPEVLKLLNLLPLCRTSALGGHMYRCSDCGYEKPHYNSCGNRHCPVCQAGAREKWLAKQEASLLDLPYFHVVFTLPGELQRLILHNKQVGYNLLFTSAAETLLKFGRDPKHGLGGQLGFTAVLHTWNQQLLPHAHLHVLIPAGALNKDTGRFEAPASRRWLFPVKALSPVFRAIFLKRLKALYKKGELNASQDQLDLSSPEAFDASLSSLYKKPWVVYAKRPFGGAKEVLGYLGRYTHRVGLTNARIQEVNAQGVSFLCRDPARPGKKKLLKLEGAEFLHRFFLHVLPKGFTRIRHYGFLGNAVRKQKVREIREQLGDPVTAAIEESLIERMARVYGIKLGQCACCGKGTMTRAEVLGIRPGKDPPACA